MTIQAVVFDIGRVLIHWEPEAFYDAQIGETRRKAFFAEVPMHQTNLDIDAGAPWKETVYALAEAHPDWATEIRWWHDRWLEMASHDIPHSARLLRALKAKGVEIKSEGAPKGHIVWATGWRGLLELSKEIERPIGNGVKGQAILLEFDRADLPQLFADALHVIPHADGTVAIGSTSERDFEDPYATDAQLDEVYQRAVDAVPALRNAPILARWAGVRPRAKSRAPMLGNHPTRAGDFIANGGFKIGFGMAPKAGEVMADLILENHDEIPEGFRPEASI